MGECSYGPLFLTSALDGSGQLHAPAVYYRGSIPGTHLIGGCVDVGAGLNTVEYRNISYQYRESNLRYPPP
jgi:hypothetical protein